jgi:hypothetical protein
VEKWGRYFKRKGWVKEGSEMKELDESVDINGVDGDGKAELRMHSVERRGEGWRWVLEIATAWAVVKALMPLRIIGCVWATPWFARIAILPITRLIGRMGRKT